MKHVTRWHPDTCDCVIDYEWDDETSNEARIHTGISVVACRFHSAPNPREHYELVLAENRRKNDFQNEIERAIGRMPTITLPDASRTLHVSGLEPRERAAAQQLIDAGFQGKAVLD